MLFYRQELTPELAAMRKAFAASIKKIPHNPYVTRMNADAQMLSANADCIEKFRSDPNTGLDSATWILPDVKHIYRGGVYTIFRIADAFSRFGNTLNRFVIMSPTANIEKIAAELENEFPNLRFEIERIDTPEEASTLAPTDVGFCTLWTTAYALLNFNQCHAKYYLVQDFEPAFTAAGSLSGIIEQTYRFGFTGICNTKGVAAKYQTYTDWLTYFTPAVDQNKFWAPADLTKPDGLQLVFYGRPANDRNAFLLGIEALRKVKEILGDEIAIISAGHEFNEADYGLEKILKNVGLLPNIDAVADLYRNSHLGLVFMYTPHPSYQPFEFMATGCVTVTNLNESTQWFLKDEENGATFQFHCLSGNRTNYYRCARRRTTPQSDGWRIKNSFSVKLGKRTKKYFRICKSSQTSEREDWVMTRHHPTTVNTSLVLKPVEITPRDHLHDRDLRRRYVLYFA